MPSSSQSIPLDPDRYSEDTRRRLYDLVRRGPFQQAALGPVLDNPLPYTAEEAGLTVLWVWGRWLAIWVRLEVESFRPAADRIEVLRIKTSTENPLGIVLHEV